jgi:hypothetical protein
MRPLCIALLLTATAAAGDLDELLEGVRNIGVPGVPGTLSVFGDKAFPVLCADTASSPAPVVAAARIGRGRVVVFAHNGYFSKAMLRQADTGRLLRNAFTWVARSKKKLGVARNAALRGFLGAEDAGGDLKRFDAVYLPIADLDDGEVEALRKFVRKGGGLVSGFPGWGWQQLNPGKDLATQNAGNRLLAPAGIVFGRGFTKVPPNRLLAVRRASPLTHAIDALDALKDKPSALAVDTLSRCVAELPPDDRLLLPRLKRLLERGEAPVPSAKKPIGAEVGKVLLAMQLRRDRGLAPERVRAHPAAAIFPGAVPKRARRVTRAIEIDARTPGWHGTGLYAPPGEVVTITTDARAPRIRIGAHKDTLWNKKKWRCAPEITREFAVTGPITKVASAFGGLIYIDARKGRGPSAARYRITGAVEAPLFVLGATGLEEWRETIRHHPAPWAELATSKVILTLPSRVVRGLDDPGALMRFWDRVLDACADLAARPRERERPERYVTDEQISAGYMHAGYPIMTHLDAAERFVDLDKLSSKGDWGMFHEMGHNHQSGAWTFSGTGEVTCNLFTIYVLETVCKSTAGHRNISDGFTREQIGAYEKDCETWKRKPFLALIMYRQLKDEFGWDAYKQVFAEYREQDVRPMNDASKRDEWMVRFSNAVGRNLGPFFEWWGVPTSAKARKSIEHLPAWMPEGQ